VKILHLNTYDMRGGAARAAYRLHSGLRQTGHDSTLLVAHRSSGDPSVKRFSPPLDFSHRVRRLWRRKAIARELGRYQQSRLPGSIFTSDRSEHQADVLSQLPKVDIINLHWIATFIDYTPFFVPTIQHTPIVWTLHDMSAFTGGCHLDQGCGKFTDQCGTCPILGSSLEHDLTRQIWRRKQAIFSQLPPERFHIVTPGRWLGQEAGRSALLKRFSRTVIPNGLDTEDFAPRDQRFSRDVLGIPQDAQVILFVAEQSDEPHKGFNFLVDALRELPDQDNLLLLSLGRISPELPANLKNIHLGHISGSDRLLSLVYSAADVFAIPSLQDNLPNTVMEALACGTPVVGFAIGGIPDMVRPGITGQLAPARDVPALRAALVELLQSPDLHSGYAERCRQIAVEEYSLDRQVQNYLALYQNLCQTR
jgi:glycosyltransferase involved in cell wall biosynthesis